MACIQALSGVLGIDVIDARREQGRCKVRDGCGICGRNAGMRFANRPLFYLILLLTVAAVVLTAYVVWKLPEAEELSRAKKKSAPPALPAAQP